MEKCTEKAIFIAATVLALQALDERGWRDFAGFEGKDGEKIFVKPYNKIATMLAAALYTLLQDFDFPVERQKVHIIHKTVDDIMKETEEKKK